MQNHTRTVGKIKNITAAIFTRSNFKYAHMVQQHKHTKYKQFQHAQKSTYVWLVCKTTHAQWVKSIKEHQQMLACSNFKYAHMVRQHKRTK